MYSVFLTAKLQTGLKNVNHLTKSTVITSFPLKVFPMNTSFFLLLLTCNHLKESTRSIKNEFTRNQVIDCLRRPLLRLRFFCRQQTINTDLVVVGAGSAGLSAAVQGAELGKKVVLLEKNPYVGGNSQHAEGLFAVDSEWNRLRSDPLTRQRLMSLY